MAIEIKALNEDLIKDYMYFFDHVAFSDGNEYEGCYCSFYHFGKEVENELAQFDDWTPEIKRRAEELIKNKTLQGFLAFDGNDVVGWVSTNKKEKYVRLVSNKDYVTEDDDFVQSISCFVVDPKRRKEGIATMLLEHVIESKKSDDVKYLEAYPRIDTFNCVFNFHGYLTTFERLGFKVYRTLEEDAIVRFEVK